MTGRAEVSRLKQRLDATFARFKALGTEIELQSDFARYLCILVSGYLENAMYELVVEYSRHNGAPSLQRFVEQRTKSFTNARAQKICDLLGDFDAEWRTELEVFMAGELKDAVDGMIGIRNKIAHGESVGVTYTTISNYYERIQRVVEFVADLCDPRSLSR
jgi:RiboL-PSP-HEPN